MQNKNLMIFLILLFSSVQTVDVYVKDQCTCDGLLSQTDCKALSGCQWTTSTNLCSKSGSDSTTTDGFCQLIIDSAECAKTKGCAYIDSSCQIFAGCSAYKGATDSDCQSISKYCNSDGEAYCVDPTACTSYKTEDDCGTKSSSGGSGTCVWSSNKCREQNCTEADSTLTTNSQCNQFISGCLTNGKGCVSKLGTCASYAGDIDSCEGLIGTDGYCKGTDGGTNCSAKTCTDAEDTLTTDAECQAFSSTCVTTGAGCVKSPLGQCSTLTGDDTTCALKKGSDGPCKGVTSGTKCSVMACTEASDSLSTDEDCNNFKSGCVTTGKGCISTRGTCSTYTGTNDTCEGYIGSDGNCKGTSDTDAKCAAKVCTDAESSNDTDDLCNSFKSGCITNGKGCVSTLAQCSTYAGDNTTCDGYIGLDGKCMGVSGGTSCSPRTCAGADTSLTTNEECSNFLNGCIATGSGGCLFAGSCPILSTQLQCSGVNTCQWNSQCVQNTLCSNITDQTICNNVKLQNGGLCYYSNSSCADRVCSNAASTLTTDADCNSFLADCVTTLSGCIESTAGCTSYKGTKSTCQTVTLKCTNTDSAVSTDACQDIDCTTNTTATSDSECAQFHGTCKTKGTGCVDKTAACTSYPGASVADCQKFIGNNIPCWWSSGQTCKNLTCADLPNTVTTDAACKTYLSTCMLNIATQTGCVDNTQSCSNLQGTQATCLTRTTLTGSNSCVRRETCKTAYTCSTIASPSNQASCDAILPGQCQFVKNACFTIGACNTYNPSGVALTDCQNAKDSNGNLCYFVSGSNCVARACSQISNPSNLSACTSHISSCARNAAGSACEDVTCGNATTKTNEAGCQAYHTSCHYTKSSGNDSCSNSLSKCSDANSSDCTTIVTNPGAKCKGSSTCQASACSDLTAQTCETTLIESASVTATQGGIAQLCKYYNSACVERTCASYTNHIGTPTSTSDCSNYLISCVFTMAGGTAACVDGGTTASNGCSKVQGTQDQCNNLLKGRIYNNGIWSYQSCYQHNTAGSVAACVDRACSQLPNAQTDQECQNYLSTCKWGGPGQGCVSITTTCETMSSTSDGCAKLTSITLGSYCRADTLATTNSACASRNCQDNGTATTDTECNNFLSGCITNGSGGCVPNTKKCAQIRGTQTTCQKVNASDGPCWGASTTVTAACTLRKCSDNTTATTDASCSEFLTGCLTTGLGCIESTKDCTNYSGLQSDCELRVGNGITCTNDSSVVTASACKVKDCTKYSGDFSETNCQTYGKQCHYNGTKCDVIQTCANLKGNIVTCAAYVASDGPCKGTALQTEAASACSVASCSDAPTSLITDQQCNNYKSGCYTTGAGCTSYSQCSNVSSSDVCATRTSGNNLICSWLPSCLTIQSVCSSYLTQGICETAQVQSGIGACTWSNNACTEAGCSDLILSSPSESVCSTYKTQSIQCTYSGSGCVTKGTCSSYTTQEACTNALSTDGVGTCAWDTTARSNSIVGCRTKICSDAVTTLITDSDCDAFISGCVTSGAGCMSNVYGCSDFQTQAKCLQDSSLNPCLWHDSKCQQYYECSDVNFTTVSLCQKISKYCTTDGTTCVPLKACATYSKQIQCSIGTDGTCGYITSTKKCQLFTACSDIVSKDNTECQTYNSGCISDGTNCIDIGECSSYADSSSACKLDGTDGSCIIDTDSKTCRLKECSDAGKVTKHDTCYAFTINSSTKCTTDGTTCIPVADCTTYTVQSGCVIDDKGQACYWDKTAKTCRLQVCTDFTKTTSSDCDKAMSGCISNGTNCIAQGVCSSYTTKVACNTSGTDGLCVFTPSSSSSKTGTCALFSQCSDANNDSVACANKALACKWTAAKGTTASSCAVQTCATAANGTTKCVTIPSFDGTKYTVCQLQGKACVTGDPTSLTKDNCYKLSQYTYSWSTASTKCIQCGSVTTNDSNQTQNNSNTTTPDTTSTYSNMLYFASLYLIVGELL